MYRHVRNGFAPPSHFSSGRQVRSVSSAVGKLAGEEHRASSVGCGLPGWLCADPLGWPPISADDHPSRRLSEFTCVDMILSGNEGLPRGSTCSMEQVRPVAAAGHDIAGADCGGIVRSRLARVTDRLAR